MTRTFAFEGCWFNIDATACYAETYFRDNVRLVSVPVPEKDLDTALRYGYGDDALRLWREHDLLHHWVAQQFGLPCSPTIWAEAHPHDPAAIPRWARLQEEEFVGAVHRWLNLDEWSQSLWPLAERCPNVHALQAQARQLLRFD